MSSLYSRKVSSTERIWLAYNEITPHIIDYIIAGFGELKLDKWTEAVRRASEVNPVMKSHLIGALAWSRWQESMNYPMVRLVNRDWPVRSDEDAEGLLDSPLDYKDRPPIEVILVNGPEAKIVFRGLHALVDGRALMHIAQECFRAYRGEPLMGSFDTSTDADIASRVRQDTHPAEHMDYVPPLSPASSPQPLGSKRLRLTLPKVSKPLPRLIQCLAKLADDKGATGKRFILPVDLRRHCNNTSMNAGNLVGKITVDINNEESIEQLSEKIKLQLADNSDCVFPDNYDGLRFLPIKILQKTFAALFNNAHKDNRFLGTAMISNLGKVSLSQLSVPEFNANWAAMYPPLQDGFPIFAGVMGHDNGLEVTLNIPNHWYNESELPRLVEAIEAAFKPEDQPYVPIAQTG